MKRKLMKATAFAPATVANVAVGFDILGFALEEIGDEVTIERINRPPQGLPVVIEEISGCASPLPLDAKLNVATAGLLELHKDQNLNFGLRVWIKKGIPIASGMGGSAASAIGALVATNALLDSPLSKKEILKYAMIGEAVASGAAHPDNIAPCLYGGLTLVRETNPLDILAIPVPKQILCVLVHPHLQLETRKSRAALKSEITLKQHVKQTANFGGFLIGCFEENLELISLSLKDVLIEPQRASLIHGFLAAKEAALKAGALGVSISGSGPSVFAWVSSQESGKRVAQALTDSFKNSGTQADSWVSPINMEGAKLIL
ncbi:MAG: homoserine kinase [Bdellovibrionia bacterium]